MEVSSMKNWRSWGVAVAILITGIVILEIILRMYFSWQTGTRIKDPDFGYGYAEGSSVFRGYEGYGTTHFSADHEIATPYTEGVSVVVMGDSYTEAYQVDDEDKYVSVAEKLLWDRGIKADLHNLGYSARMLPDYLYEIDTTIELYQPKILVLQFSYINLITKKDMEKSRNNSFKRMPDGTLQVQHRQFQFPANPLLFTYLNRSFSIVQHGLKRIEDFKRSISGNQDSPEDMIYKMSNNTELENEIVLAKIAAIREKFRGIKTIIILCPPYPSNEDGRIILENPQYDQLVMLFKGVPEWNIIDPSTQFLDLKNKGLYPNGFNNTLPGTGHWNTNGHTIVGQLLANELEEILK